MYFNGIDVEGEFDNPDIFVFRREFFAISSNLDVNYGLRNHQAPTHTEDGIPIRKLYVSNLPPKTTWTELFGVFTQYGFVKSCWLRMGDRGPNKAPTPTYAFVTYSNPSDAHKALLAPAHEKTLRGRNLRISPADSWHQPAEDADGHVRWKPRGNRRQNPTAPDSADAIPETSSENAESVSEANEPMQEAVEPEDESYTILDILNHDCLSHILEYVPLRDLIRSERVSKRWQAMVQDYLLSIRTFKTSWWGPPHASPLTTAVLRKLLARLGGSLHALHIDHMWSALNDRTAHSVGKFCPNLEELKVVGMHTKNWNPLIYGCKQLKKLSFVSCNKLTDTSLVHLVKNESCIESLSVANNTHVTGLFLTGTNPPKLNSLSFNNCYSLQGTVLSAAIDNLPMITSLKLDLCPVSLWKIMPMILMKIPKLEELSLSEYTSMPMEVCASTQGTEALCEALGTLSELKVLDLSRNIFITNAVLKQVAQSCSKLRSLDVACCNSRYPVGESTRPFHGITDDGILSITSNCSELRSLNVSYLAGLTDSGLAGLTRCKRLTTVIARGSHVLTAAPFCAAITAVEQLQEVDVCGCDNVCADILSGAVVALSRSPRALSLHVASTIAANALRDQNEIDVEIREGEFEYPVMSTLPAETFTHPLLRVNWTVDRHNPHLRPDFVDRNVDSSSDGSFDDYYDPDDFDDFLGPGTDDDDLYLEGDIEDYEDLGMYAYELGPEIFLM